MFDYYATGGTTMLSDALAAMVGSKREAKRLISDKAVEILDVTSWHPITKYVVGEAPRPHHGISVREDQAICTDDRIQFWEYKVGKRRVLRIHGTEGLRGDLFECL